MEYFPILLHYYHALLCGVSTGSGARRATLVWCLSVLVIRLYHRIPSENVHLMEQCLMKSADGEGRPQ